MYLQKRQSVSISDSPLLVHRRRRDVEPHADLNDSSLEMLEESVESPALNDTLRKTTPTVQKAVSKIILPNFADKEAQMQVVDSEQSIYSKSGHAPLPAVDSQPLFEYPQNNLCKNYAFPLTKTEINGKNYYNMSVSIKKHKNY